MDNMKNWIIKNISNFFGILGIVLTIYFSVFYVPAWIKESQNEKINNSKQELIQSIKELVFSDSTITITEIQSLVIAKEIEKKVRVPYSFYELLTICEDSYMEDKFLPLQKRRELIQELEVLKSKLTVKEDRVEKLTSKENSIANNLITIIVSLLGLILSFAGLFSTYYKNKKSQQQEEEISNELEDANVDSNNRQFAQNVEMNYLEIIKGIAKNKVFEPNNKDTDYDLLISQDDDNIYFEFKILTKSNVGLGAFKRFADFIKNKGGKGVFIYNTNLTTMVKNEIEKTQKEGIKIKVIKVTSETELKEKVEEILHTTGVWQNGGISA